MTYTVARDCQVQGLAQIYQERFGERASGAYVEVGAFNGVNWSCSIGLAKLGWIGILIEPNPEYYADCVKNYRNYPNVKIVPLAAGDHDGLATLYLGGSNTTTVREMIEVYNSLEWSRISGLDVEKYIQVEMRTLDTILAESGCPNPIQVMVIDVEGAEVDVLEGLDLDTWQVEMFIIETHEKNEDKRLAAKAAACDAILLPRGYEKIYADYINTIYWKPV